MKNNIPLDQINPRLSEITDPRQRHWAEVSLRLPLDDVDEADEDTLNRILWHRPARPRRYLSRLGGDRSARRG